MTEEHVIHGPAPSGILDNESLGVQIFQTLKNKINSSEPAIVDVTSKTEISYRNFLEATCKIAQWLKSSGCKQDDIIGICSENNVNFFKPVVAALYEGCIIAPINNNYSQAEMMHALKLVKPKIMFCSKETYPKYLSLHLAQRIPFIKKIIILESMEQLMASIVVDINTFQPNRFDPYKQLAALLYSSGTTGSAKAAMISHASIIRHNQTTIFQNELAHYNSTIQLIPFSHSYGFIHSLSIIQNGVTQMFMQKFDENIYLQTVQDKKLKVLTVSPKMAKFLTTCKSLDKYDLSSVKVIVCATGPLSKELEDLLKNKLKVSTVIPSYNLAESTNVLSIGESKSRSSGKPLSGISLKIHDRDTGKNLGPNKVGELCLKGDFLMKGYYGNPAATKSVFTSDGWLLTGDLAYYDNEGYFYIVKRVVELIHFRDDLISPAELENLLVSHPKIKDAAVIGVPHKEDGERPMALIVKKENIELKENEVTMFIDGQVSVSKRLSGGIKFVHRIIRDSKGQVMRKEMKDFAYKLMSKL